MPPLRSPGPYLTTLCAVPVPRERVVVLTLPTGGDWTLDSQNIVETLIQCIVVFNFPTLGIDVFLRIYFR
jgi:hypothetical protein